MNRELIRDKKDVKICPESTGVYWLYKKKFNGWNIVYIGISNNFKRRFGEHLPLKDFDGFYYEETDYETAKKREKELLESYKYFTGSLPLLNRQIG